MVRLDRPAVQPHMRDMTWDPGPQPPLVLLLDEGERLPGFGGWPLPAPVVERLRQAGPVINRRKRDGAVRESFVIAPHEPGGDRNFLGQVGVAGTQVERIAVRLERFLVAAPHPQQLGQRSRRVPGERTLSRRHLVEDDPERQAAPRNPLRERIAADELHRDEVDVPAGLDRVDRDDVGVLDRGEGARGEAHGPWSENTLV